MRVFTKTAVAAAVGFNLALYGAGVQADSGRSEVTLLEHVLNHPSDEVSLSEVILTTLSDSPSTLDRREVEYSELTRRGGGEVEYSVVSVSRQNRKAVRKQQTAAIEKTDFGSDASEVTYRVETLVQNAVSAVDWTSGTTDPVLSREAAVTSSSDTNDAQGATPGEGSSGRYVILSNVEFEGNEVVSNEVLKAVANPFVGRRIGLSDLEELRIQLTQAYVDRGYLNSGAILPDQKVEAGNIVYKIVEGDITAVNIEGDGDLLEKYIKDRLLDGAATPFNSVALQENFQLLLDDPLIERLDGQLQALPQNGQTALDLTIVRGRPYDLSVNANNHGAPSLGAQQLGVSAIRRNITGVGDEVGLTVGGNLNKVNISAFYEIPLDSKETKVRAEVTFADSIVVEEPFDSVDIESRTTGFDVSYSRDLKRSVKETFTVGSGFAVRENANRLADEPFSFSTGEVNGKSRVSVARLWQEYVKRGGNSVLALRSTLNVGLDLLGSTIHEADLPSSDFMSLQGQMQYSYRDQRSQRLFLLRADAQLTDSQLLPLERFALGGASSVRGYRENELVRDQALFASAEVHQPIWQSDSYGDFQLAPFVDMGVGENRGFFTDQEILASVGLGLLWSNKKNYAGEIYFGFPLRDLESSDGNSLQEKGIHLRFSSDL